MSDANAEKPDLTSSSPPTTSWIDHVTHLTKGKEGLLIAAAIPFFLGYMAMVANAYRNKLGFIPPLQPQCVLAGIFPTLVLILASLFMKFWLYLESEVLEWLVQTAITVRNKKMILGFFCLMAFLPPMYPIYASFKRATYNSQIWNPIFFVCTLALLSTLYVYFKYDYHLLREMIQNQKIRAITLKEANTTGQVDNVLEDIITSVNQIAKNVEEHDRKTARSLRIASVFPLLELVIVALGFWVSYAYPHLPQEFGGMQPRLAYLAVTRAQLSPEMRQAVLPTTTQKLPIDPSKDALAVSQTQLLDVVYENADAMMVRVHDSKRDNASEPATVYQIKKASIQGATWCGFDHK